MSARERPPSEPEPPAKQPRLLAEASAHETLVLNGRELTLAVVTAWDGSGTLGAHRTAWTQRNYLADDFADSEESSTEGCLGPVSRAEKKVAQRELPVSLILKQTCAPGYIELFMAAARKEEQSWALWSPVAPVPDAEADKTMADPRMKSRILTARSAFRDKASGRVPADDHGVTTNLSDVRAKCRVVLRGYRDPDLELLSRHSPVSLRVSLHVLLQIASSKLTAGWQIVAAEISTAFLQGGRSSSRQGELYMIGPKGERALAVLYKLVTDKLLATVHVDDLLFVVDLTSGVLDRIRSCFEWGSWNTSSLASPSQLVFCGKEITIVQRSNSMPAHVKLSQQTFMEDTEHRNITARGRTDPHFPGLPKYVSEAQNT
eukprot:6491868-Amphidinium_carterae.3